MLAWLHDRLAQTPSWPVSPQVGNAVPPPLAAALGRQLRKVLEERRKQAEDAAMEQFGF